MSNIIIRTQQEVEAEALRLARDIVDYDRSDEEREMTGHNLRRLNRLDLGAVIHSAPDPTACKQRVAASGPLSLAELEDIHIVATFNIESGANDWLREIRLSFTQNRMLAGRKVKMQAGTELPSVADRLAALRQNIERNNGVFKEDAAFREAMSILVAPNSVENIIERVQRDPAFRKQVEEKGLYLIPPSSEDDKREQEKPSGRLRLDPWVVRINDLRYSTHHLLDMVFNDPNAPAGLYDNCQRSIKDLQAICDLIEGRSRMEEGA